MTRLSFLPKSKKGKGRAIKPCLFLIYKHLKIIELIITCFSDYNFSFLVMTLRRYGDGFYAYLNLSFFIMIITDFPIKCMLFLMRIRIICNISTTAVTDSSILPFVNRLFVGVSCLIFDPNLFCSCNSVMPCFLRLGGLECWRLFNRIARSGT